MPLSISWIHHQYVKRVKISSNVALASSQLNTMKKKATLTCILKVVRQ